MKVTLESTTKIVRIVVDGREVPARVWEGETSSGIPCHAYVTRIAVADGNDTAEFDRELMECRRPSPEVDAIPTRLVV